ncbi:hypothetical protein AGMMS50276_16080 [Synergistales bacterium]|nr:hypothetical protein AGMMS50276_16080 [Synergistales bacterium]
MDMKTNITQINPEDVSASKWAGGVTRQIAIWPPDARYAKRDFEWRLSSATVDLEESTFTSLPGFHRILLILDGAVGVTHKTPLGERHKDLKAFDQDSFEGSWETTSVGRCVDFNLMLSERCYGSVSVLNGETDKRIDVFRSPSKTKCVVTEAFYCLADSFSYCVKEKGFKIEFGRSATIHKGGALLLQRAFSESELYLEVELNIDASPNRGEWGVRATVVSPF